MEQEQSSSAQSANDTSQKPSRNPLRVGVGGPVGSGKTALLDKVCKVMRENYDIAVVDDLTRKFTGLDVIFIESGGDNLSATFSPELADLTIYVIDVSEGEKIPRKGGPGITRSDLLVINKIDLAPYVGASLDVMQADTKRMRGDRPYVMSNLKTSQGVDEIIRFIVKEGML